MLQLRAGEAGRGDAPGHAGRARDAGVGGPGARGRGRAGRGARADGLAVPMLRAVAESADKEAPMAEQMDRN